MSHLTMTTDDCVAATTRPWLDVEISAPAGRVAFAEHGLVRTVVWLCGEHDIDTVASLSEIVARAIAPDEADVEFDLSDVQYMSAATIGVIVRTRAWLEVRSRSLVLRSPSNIARRLCDLCGLDYVSQPDPRHAAEQMATVGADRAIAGGVVRGGT